MLTNAFREKNHSLQKIKTLYNFYYNEQFLFRPTLGN